MHRCACCFLSLLVVGLAAEERVPISQVPAVVTTAVTAEPGAVIAAVERDREDGWDRFAVQVRVGTVDHEYLVTPDGTIHSHGHEVALEALPADLPGRCAALMPGLVLVMAWKETVGDQVGWYLEGRAADDRRVEIAFEPGGSVHLEVDDPEAEDDRQDEDGVARPDDAGADF